MIRVMITLLVLMFISTTVSANDGRDKWPHKKSYGINYKKFHKKHQKAARRIHKCHYVD